MDLSIPWDAEVSGLHAELHGIGGEWAIVDDGLSTNGTFVNAQRVAARQRLRDGDRVRLGRTILVYKAGSSPPVPPTVAASDGPPPQTLTATQRKVLIALCRPYRDGASFTSPATNQQIAEELFLSVEAVKMHLRTLFGKFELGELPAEREAHAARRVRAAVRRDLAPGARLVRDDGRRGRRACGARPARRRPGGATPSACAHARASSPRSEALRRVLGHAARDHGVERRGGPSRPGGGAALTCAHSLAASVSRGNGTAPVRQW